MKQLSIFIAVALLSACGDNSQEGSKGNSERVTPVIAAHPQQRDIDYVLTALGSVESISDPTVSAETSGQVKELAVREGDEVTEGQLLVALDATLHSIDTAKAEAENRRAEVLLDNQEKEVRRLTRLSETQSVSQDQLEDQQAQLEILKAQRDVAKKQWEQALHMESKTRVTAPIAGLVTRRHVSRGDYVAYGQPLFDLVSIDRLRARIAFPEHEAARIQVGKLVQLNSPAAPGETAIGEVTAVNPQIKTHNRAVEVTVEFDNPGNWKPGASIDATLIVEQRSQALTVPVLAINRRNGEDVVFVIEQDKVRAQAVRTGWREGDWVEITRGLTTNQRIVVEGSAMLSDGSLVNLRSSVQ